MGDFDTCDKYMSLIADLGKNPGLAISMKLFKNLDALLEVAIFDFREYAHIELTDEQKEYIAATVSAGEMYEHLIDENMLVPDAGVFHVSFSDITQEYEAKNEQVYIETPNTIELARTLFHAPLKNFDGYNHKSAMKYIKEAFCNNGNVEAIFEEAEIGKRLGSGFRLYAKTESWTKMMREFRGAAQAGKSVVVDMNNCHWSIWAWLYRDNKEICEGIKKYTNNVEQVREEAAKFYKVTKDRIKNLFIRIQFGGSETKWKQDFAKDINDTFPLAKELQGITAKIKKDVAGRFPKWLKEISKTDKIDPELTLMSYVLQKVERLCVDNIHQAFGKRMLSRLHDEANIRVDCETVDLILANKAICAIVPTMRSSLSHNEPPNWSKKMFWEEEKYFSICTIKDLKSFMITDAVGAIRTNPKMHTNFYANHIKLMECVLDKMKDRVYRNKAKLNRDYILDENGQVEMGLEAKRKAAEILKAEIETFGNAFGQFLIMLYANRFFVQFNDSVCKFTYDDNDMIQNIECFSAATFKQIYQEKIVPNNDFEDMYLKSDTKYKLKTFAEMYLGSMMKRRVDGIGFYPQGAPLNHLNTFYGIQIQPIDHQLEEVKRFKKDLYNHWRIEICNADRDVFEFMLDWHATRFQPKHMHKLIVMCFIYSRDQGTGKGWLFDQHGLMEKLLKRYYKKVTHTLSSPNGLLGRFNDAYKHKLYYYCDENGEFIHSVKGNAALLDWTSTQERDWKAEGKPPVPGPCCGALMMTSNDKKGCPKKHRGSRRLLAVEGRNTYSMLNAMHNIEVQIEDEHGSKTLTVMTMGIRDRYFENLKDAIKNPLVRESIVHDFVNRNIEHRPYEKIPQTEFGEQLEDLTKCVVEDFLEKWIAGNVRIKLPAREVDIERNGSYFSAQSATGASEYTTKLSRKLLYAYNQDQILGCDLLQGRGLWVVFRDWIDENKRNGEIVGWRLSDFIDRLGNYLHAPTNLIIKKKTGGNLGGFMVYQLNPDKFPEGYTTSDEENDPAKHRDKRARAAERRNADNTGNGEYVLAAPAT